MAIKRYADSNVPVEYWDLDMDSDFTGDPKLLSKYNEIVSDLPAVYKAGMSLCFAGSHGIGKSMAVTNIIKSAVLKGYFCIYTTLSDVVNALLSYDNHEKGLARRELTSVDFLVLDEFDSRFVSTDNASDLFGRTLESVLRTRSQNRLPTFMCTNSPNPVETFQGSIKQSLDSLMSGYVKNVIVLGDDYRKSNPTKHGSPAPGGGFIKHG